MSRVFPIDAQNELCCHDAVFGVESIDTVQDCGNILVLREIFASSRNRPELKIYDAVLLEVSQDRISRVPNAVFRVTELIYVSREERKEPDRGRRLSEMPAHSLHNMLTL